MGTMMLTDILSLLTRTPAALDALLRGLPDGVTLANEGAATWSPFDIVAHLIHAERTDWMPRVTMIMTVGESRAFEPFDREGDVRDRRRSASLDQLLDEFARVRADNLTALRGLDLAPADLDRRGTHPALGAVTLSQLLATWAAHDLTHLHQISRVMAHRYRDAVGPWSAYLGVLQCAGHSAS